MAISILHFVTFSMGQESIISPHQPEEAIPSTISRGEIVTRTETTDETGVETTEVTYTTNHETLEAGVLEQLVSWKDIPDIGDTVSGIGTYSTVFSLPEERDGTEKVFFTAESFQLGTAALWVERVVLPPVAGNLFFLSSLQEFYPENEMSQI